MAYPFGGVPLGLLRHVLGGHFGIEERETDGPVDTLDGPKQEKFWFNPTSERSAEIPGYGDEHRLSAELLGHISRRLKIDHAAMLGRLMMVQNDADRNRQ